MKRALSSVDGSEADFEVFDRKPTSSSSVDANLMELNFPEELEEAFAAAIFELGLRYSSPKVIIPLLPNESAVNKEHIKSHLQKYRIHHPRSREEFLIYYNSNFKNSFSDWVSKKGWVSNSPRTSTNRDVNSDEKNSNEVDGTTKNSNDHFHAKDGSNSTAIAGEDTNTVVLTTNNITLSVQQKLEQQQAVTEQLIVQAENIIVNWKNLFSQSFSHMETSILNLKSFLSQMNNSNNDVRLLLMNIIIY